MTTTSETPETLRRAQMMRLQKAQAAAPIAPGTYCDKCDRGRAVARAIVNDSPLYFCDHHLRKHRPSLEGNPMIVLYVEDVKP